MEELEDCKWEYYFNLISGLLSLCFDDLEGMFYLVDVYGKFFL